MTRILDDRSLDSLFRAARPCRSWLDKPVSDAIIEAVWELAKLLPTSTGVYPARIVFIPSLEAKQQLLAALAAQDLAAPADSASTVRRWRSPIPRASIASSLATLESGAASSAISATATRRRPTTA